jgi:crossover junction endodeoxyribonuclease RuvC
VKDQSTSARAGIRILGIDPGSQRLGLACLVTDGAGAPRLAHVETIVAPRSADGFYGRMREILRVLRDRVVTLEPTVLAVETGFTGKNPFAAAHLAEMRGAAIGICLEQGLPIEEYAPAQVKSVVTGSGRADKAQVQRMVSMVLGHRFDGASEAGYDASDAAAVALCHWQLLPSRPWQESGTGRRRPKESNA